MDALNQPSIKLLRKLESIATLPQEARQAVLRLPVTVCDFKPDSDILQEGDRPSQCCLVIEGFLCRYKLTEHGKRQIFSFHIPGDIADLHPEGSSP